MVEFPSNKEAKAKSDMAETGEFGARIAKLCDELPTFRNLDVTREDQM